MGPTDYSVLAQKNSLTVFFKDGWTHHDVTRCQAKTPVLKLEIGFTVSAILRPWNFFFFFLTKIFHF